MIYLSIDQHHNEALLFDLRVQEDQVSCHVRDCCEVHVSGEVRGDDARTAFANYTVLAVLLYRSLYSIK